MSRVEEQQQLLPFQSKAKVEIFPQENPDRAKYFQMRAHNKNEEDCDHIQMTSPTQNLVSDLSNIFHEDKRRCVNCAQVERKLAQREHQLQGEKKKNVKYLKIINTKVDKEKELQGAYYEIAKQLKKRIDAASGYELQRMISSDGNDEVGRLREAVEKMKEEIAEKDRVIEMERQKDVEKMLNLLEQEKNGQEEGNKESTEKCSKLHLALETNILNIKLWNLAGLQKARPEKSMQSIEEKHYLSVENKSLKQKSGSNSKIDKDELEVQNFIFKKEQECNNLRDESYKMQQKEREQEYNTVRQWEQQSFYSVNNSKILHTYLQNPFEQGSFLTSFEGQAPRRESSYYSIPEGQGLEYVQISNVSMKNSFSNIQNDRKSQKQILNHLSMKQSQRLSHNHNQRQTILQRYNYEADIINQLDIYRERTHKFAENVKELIQKLNERFNHFGSRYKIIYQLPAVFNNHVEPARPENSIIQSERLDHIFNVFSLQLQKLLKSQRKEYQKMLNDRQLTLHDLQSKYIQLQNEKKQLQKTNDNYLMHKSVLQVKLLELQEKLQGLHDGKQNTMAKSEFAINYRRKVSAMLEEKIICQQTQCELIPSSLLDKSHTLETTNNKYIQAINYIPHFLNQMLANKEIKTNFLIDFTADLEKQLDSMLRRSITQLQTETNVNDLMVRRIRSASLCLSPKESESDHHESIRALKNEKQNLAATLKQKTEEAFKLNEKLTLQKMEKATHERQVDLLKAQIQRLKNELALNESHSPIVQIIEAVSQPSPCKLVHSRSSEFHEYEQKKEYNNLYWERDLQVKQLRQKLEVYQSQLSKYRLKAKKKQKIFYLNH